MRGFEEAAQNNDKAAAEKGDNNKQAAFPNLVDLHRENNVNITKSELLQAAEPFAMPLNNYITLRDAQENEQSYFKVGATMLTRLGRTMIGADDPSSKFDEARKTGNMAAMATLEHADKEQRVFESKVAGYGGAALKTALLFSGGKAGLFGFAALTTADEAKPGDAFPTQLTDAALGAAKGLGMKFVFNQIDAQTWNPVIKGWTLGVSDRFVDVGLSRHTYENHEGNVDFKAGALKTLSSVFSPPALAVDAGTGLAGGALIGLDAYLKGAYFANPVASRLTMAGVAGLTNGSLEELNHQQDNPKRTSIDWAEVTKVGLQKAAIATVSAVPNSGLIKLK